MKNKKAYARVRFARSLRSGKSNGSDRSNRSTTPNHLNATPRSISTNQLAALLLPLLLVLGALVRLKVYLENRSLFLDEANVARNIVERNFSGFFTNLDYQQFAPPFFLCWEKLHTLLFGNSEYALRLLPLLAGVAGLWLVWKISCKLIDPPIVQLVPLFLYAFNYDMIRYGTEAKQYATDVFTALLLLFLALRKPVSGFRQKDWLTWAGIGMIAPWFSMSSVFILAGVGAYFFFQLIREKSYGKISGLSLIIISWLGSFAAYYFGILNHDIKLDYLQNYHLPYFLPFPPASAADWQKTGNIFLSLFNTALGFTVIAYIFGILAFLAGCWKMRKTKPLELLLLCVPILASLLASGLEKYSLIPRLTLFFIPALTMIIAYGIEWTAAVLPRWGTYILLLICLLILPLRGGLYYLVAPLEIEEVREVLAYVHENQQAGEAVFVHDEAVPAVVYYQEYHPDRERLQLKGVQLAHYDENVDILETEDFWLIFSHRINANTEQKIQKNLTIARTMGQLQDTFETEGAAAFYFKN